MSAITTGLNNSDGSNRIRWENMHQRLQKINVDILHKVRDNSIALEANNNAPDSGALGCYFQDELEQMKKLETAPHFKKFQFEIQPFVQSLPELIHHQDRVVTMLESQITNAPPGELQSYFHLISILAKDLNDDLEKHFSSLFETIMKVVDEVAHSGSILKGKKAPNPELTGKLFECLSYLLKSQLTQLAKDPDCLRQYYGPLLGNSTHYVRDMAAKSFVIVMRKLSVKTFRKHSSKIFKALTSNGKTVFAAHLQDRHLFECAPLESPLQQTTLMVGNKRLFDLMEGVSGLLFYSLKGVKGCLHSKGTERLAELFSLLVPVSKDTVDSLRQEVAGGEKTLNVKGEKAKKGAKLAHQSSSDKKEYSTLSAETRDALDLSARSDTLVRVFTVGQIVGKTYCRIFRHIHPSNAAELWMVLATITGDFCKLLSALAAVTGVPAEMTANVNLSLLVLIEAVYFALCHSNGRGLSDADVKDSVSEVTVNRTLDLAVAVLGDGAVATFGDKLVSRTRILICRLWIQFPSHPVLVQRIDHVLKVSLGALLPSPAVVDFTTELLPSLPDHVIRRHLVKPAISVIAELSRSESDCGLWLSTLLEVLMRLTDSRDSFTQTSHSSHLVMSSRAANPRDEALEEGWGHSDDSDGDADDDSSEASENSESESVAATQTRTSGPLVDGCGDELGVIALICLRIVQNHLKVALKAKSSAATTDGNHENSLVALKCLQWMTTSVPNIFVNKTFRSEVAALVTQMLTLLQSKGAGVSSLRVTFLSHLLSFCSSNLSQCVSFASDADAIKAVTKNLVAEFVKNPRSIALSWALNEFLSAIASLVATQDPSVDRVLSAFLNAKEQIALITVLADCLSTPSYWLRFNVVKLLSHLTSPQLASVDGAEKEAEAQVVDVAGICLEISSLRADVSTEREFARLLGMLEVVMRAGRLPTHYVRLICAFCLGLMHVKFKAVWEPAVLVLVSAAGHSESEEVLWPLLLNSIHVIGSQMVEKPVQAHCEDHDKVSVTVASKTRLVDNLRALELLDSGEARVGMEVASSDAFYYIVQNGTKQNRLLVEPDARTDVETTYATVWNILKRCPMITLKRSKVVVPFFLNFLTKQYYAVFSEDPEIPFLRKIGFFASVETAETNNAQYPVLPVRTLKRRLEMFLQVFAAVTGPKQLFQHQMLYAYFHEIMCKPDIAVVKLAFDCIVAYKPVEIVPYKDSVRRLLEDKTIRDELVNLDLSLESGAIKLEHREEIIPLLVRTVFGRFVSKSRGSKAAREQSLARRAASLSFLSKLQQSETRHLAQLMLRGVIPSALLNAKAEAMALQSKSQKTMTSSQHLVEWYGVVDGVLSGLTAASLRQVPWERQVGFLHLLEQVTRIVGFGMTGWVKQIHAIVFHMVVNAQNCRVEACQSVAAEDVHVEREEKDEESEDEADDLAEERVDSAFSVVHKNANQSARVRTLCLLRISELIHQYHAVFDFQSDSVEFFSAIAPLVTALPGSISGSSKPPSMLRIFHALISYGETTDIVATNPDTVRTVIMCVAAQAEPAVVFMIMDTLNALLDWNEGISILPHAHLIIESFSKRFVGAEHSGLSELKLSEMHITPSGSVKQELKLLCRIADGVFSRADVQIDNLAVANLTTLLLGMLRTYTTSRKVRVEEDWAINILKIYKSLLWRVQDVTSHVSFISRLFGPALHSLSLFNLSSVRAELTSVFAEMARHPSTKGLISLSSAVMEEITSEDPKLIGARDFGRVMPVFQSLSGEVRSATGDAVTPETASWSSLLGPEATDSPRLASMCSAVVYEVMRCMYDKELIVRSAALSCLRKLIVECGGWSGFLVTSDNQVSGDQAWLDVLRSIVTPAIRRGIKQSTDVVKKGFIMLLSHLVQTLGRVPALHADEMFHSDLLTLVHEDPEQNFFENISHIQFHRRMRAMNRLKIALTSHTISVVQTEEKTADGEGKTHSFTGASFIHVLLPLAYHYLFSDEFQKKDHQALMQEAAVFVGAVGAHLQWNHYFSAIKMLLKQLGKQKEEKEKVLLTALCALLDSFHFDLSGDKVLEGIVLPSNSRADEGGGGVKPGFSRKGKGKSEPVSAVLGKVEQDLARKGEDSDSDHGSVENGDNALDGDHEVEEEGLPAQRPETEEPEVVEVVPEPIVEMEEEEEEEEVGAKEESYLTIARAVVNSILPWVKVFLLKEGKDHKNQKSFTVQPHVALALTKLIRRLEAPVVSEAFKSHLFTNLVISVVNTLKSRDASARDIARESLSRMISTLGLIAMKSVFYELTMILKEGFQRHVCNYTVKSILSTAMIDYSPPSDAISVPLELMNGEAATALENFEPVVPDFDRSIPLIVSCVLDDLTGDAQDDRTADTALRSLIREAKGSKANDTLEITARCLLFRPTYALLNPKSPASTSSIHGLTVPLLDLLVNNDNSELMGRTAEALQRIALGLSKNVSVDAKELLLYLHATLQPFVSALIRDFEAYRETLGQIQRPTHGKRKQLLAEELEDFAALDEDLPSYLREESSDEDERALYATKKARHDDVTGRRAASWLPSDRSALVEQRAVVEERNKAQMDRYKVQDGASAPKLSGHNRYNRGAQGTKHGKGSGIALSSGTGGAADPSALAAIRFCLTLFNSCLRQDKLDSQDAEIQAMAVPFLPLLGKCLQLPGASNVVALAVKCITTLVGWGITIESNYFRALSNRLLRLMFRGGALVSTDNELSQACLKGLTALFKVYNTKAAQFEETKEQQKATGELGEKPEMPLGEKNIRSLLQMLTVSVMEITSSFQSAAFQLIKEIVATRILIPELYDLVTKLAEQIVLSQRKGVRESASSIVVTFIINYPLGEKRVESQMKQLLNNCSYEYEDGRCAALETLTTLCKLLPVPVLEDYAMMLFLPMTLRVVNDSSGRCREAAGELIVTLTRRVGADTVVQLQDYAIRWLNSPVASVVNKGAFDASAKALVRTGSQIIGLLVKARPDLLKKSNNLPRIVAVASQAFVSLLNSSEGGASRQKGSIWKREMSLFAEGQGDSGGSDAWAVIYQLLCLLENLYANLPTAVDFAITHLDNEALGGLLLMEQVQEAMLFPHAWVRSVALRVLQQYLSRRDVTRARLSLSADGCEILTQPNSLYHLARRLCVVINQPTLPAAMFAPLTGSLVFAIRAMLRNPDLAVVVAEEPGEEGAAPDSEGEEEDVYAENEDEQNLVETGVRTVRDDAAGLTGANWVMQRLRGIGADSRGNRRIHVMKVFLALIAAESVEFVTGFINQIIEVTVRASLAAERLNAEEDAAVKETKELALELLGAIELKVGSAVFIGAFGAVQRQIQESKSEKKRIAAAEAITNPQSYASKKIAHTQKKKESRKRKNERHALAKGIKKPKARSSASAIIDYEDF